MPPFVIRESTKASTITSALSANASISLTPPSTIPSIKVVISSSVKSERLAKIPNASPAPKPTKIPL